MRGLSAVRGPAARFAPTSTDRERTFPWVRLYKIGRSSFSAFSLCARLMRMLSSRVAQSLL